MRGRTRCLLMVIIMSICMTVGCGTEPAENATTKSVAQTTVSVSKEQTTQSVANTEKVTKEKTTEAVTEKTEAVAPQVEEKQQAVEEPVVSNNSGSSTMVWIPKSGKKYHRSSSCSNMKNPSQVTLEKAQSLGYTPCSKCY